MIDTYRFAAGYNSDKELLYRVVLAAGVFSRYFLVSVILMAAMGKELNV